MNRRKFLTLLIALVAAAALTWGVVQSSAAAPKAAKKAVKKAVKATKKAKVVKAQRQVRRSECKGRDHIGHPRAGGMATPEMPQQRLLQPGPEDDFFRHWGE